MAIRAFVAAFPPTDGRTVLHDATRALRDQLAREAFRAVPAENYHVTLRFLGAIDPDVVPRIHAILAPIAAVATPVRCRSVAIRALPSARRARVIALELASDDALDALGREVQHALTTEFGRADHDFLPHLTILRGKRPTRFDARLSVPALELDLATIGLYRSDTDSRGARYMPLFELPLGGMQ
jgi:RNA 2',3'-cyclic 3'-phosphodiesterase